ncbi:MAG: hypothetical protein H7836_06280 [Magnetococcus sp. YQC-3]
MNNKFAIIGDIVVGFLDKEERAAWLLSHPFARVVGPRQFPPGKKRRDAVPAFLFDAISQEFPPDQAEFCIQSMWNRSSQKKRVAGRGKG